MPSDFAPVFEALKPLLAKHSKRLAIKPDTEIGYVALTKSPSPFPRHKGEPLFFGSIRTGKAYVSFHLLPLYLCPELAKLVSPALKKRMQGKACFNFKKEPEPELLDDLKRLIEASLKLWAEKKWL